MYRPVMFEPGKPLLSQKDRELVESLIYDPEQPALYEITSGTLTWDDELPFMGPSRELLYLVKILWIARSRLHNGRPIEDGEYCGDKLCNIWERALKEIPSWPGFKRLVLSEKDRAYLEESRTAEF